MLTAKLYFSSYGEIVFGLPVLVYSFIQEGDGFILKYKIITSSNLRGSCKISSISPGK